MIGCAMDDLFGDLFEFHQSIKKTIEPRRREGREGFFYPNRVHQPIRRRLVLRFEQSAQALRAMEPEVMAIACIMYFWQTFAGL